MTVSLVIEQVINGIMTGAMYALFAVGLALILGVMDVVNTAHGEIYMLGAYTTVGAALGLGIGPWFYLPVTALMGFFVGLLIELVFVRRLRARPGVDVHLSSMILTFGIGMIIQNLALQIFGPKFRKAPELVHGSTELWGMVFINGHLLASALAVASIALLTVFLRYTRLGRAIRATAQNPAAARLVGISTGRIAALTFAISAALAALAGALLGPLYYVQPTMGTNLLLKGFAVVIVGGMGSVPGAIVGAFLLGISESVGATILSYGYKDAIGFMLLALTLLFRPGGIFGAVARA